MTSTDSPTQPGVRRPLRVLLALLAVTTTLPVLVLGAARPASAASGASAAPVPAAAARPGQCMSVAVTQRFGNGVIPAATLCPIRSVTAGELLRTDAA